MLNPISVVEENSEQTVYEYATIYLWILYAILAIIGIGFISQTNLITGAGSVLMIIYFFTVSTKYRKHGKEMKQATSKGSIQITGNKWSFKNPLRVTIPKELNTEPGGGGNSE